MLKKNLKIKFIFIFQLLLVQRFLKNVILLCQNHLWSLLILKSPKLWMIKLRKKLQLYIQIQPWSFIHYLNFENLFESSLSQNEQKSIIFHLVFKMSRLQRPFWHRIITFFKKIWTKKSCKMKITFIFKNPFDI